MRPFLLPTGLAALATCFAAAAAPERTPTKRTQPDYRPEAARAGTQGV